MEDNVNKFLEEVISIVVGKQGEGIVSLLEGNKYVNEFLIAKKLDITINQARNILYKVSDYGLVSSIRKKDKKKGWYTYFWKIEVLKSLEFIRNDLLKKMDNLQHQIKSRENKRFYVCEKCHVELNEENALFNNFTCTECGSILVLKDNSKMINEMKRNLERLRKDLGFVQQEIAKENQSLEKKKSKEMKKERKELEGKKLIQKLERMKKKKADKKLEKKTFKKHKFNKKQKVKKNFKKREKR